MQPDFDESLYHASRYLGAIGSAAVAGAGVGPRFDFVYSFVKGDVRAR